MRSTLLMSVLALVLLTPAAAEADNVGCFEWYCDVDNYCEFDASCTTITEGSVWRYRWDFGDGSSVVLTGSPTISHQYDNLGTFEVDFSVSMFGTSDEPAVTCFLGTPPVGPPAPNWGTCQE